MMMSLMSPTRMTALAGTTHSEPGPQVDFLEGQLEKLHAVPQVSRSLVRGNTQWKYVRLSAHLAGFERTEKERSPQKSVCFLCGS